MKSKEELNALKNEAEALNAKLAELTEDELAQVVGGMWSQEGMDSQIPSEDGQDEILYDISAGPCPFCKIPMKCDNLNKTTTIHKNAKCPKCGYTMPDSSLL